MNKYLLLILIFTSCFLAGCSSGHQEVIEEEVVKEKDNDNHKPPTIQVMTLGTYAGLPRLSNGRTDIPTLINQLKDLNANTYNWLIWRGMKDWEDLVLFMPLAKQNNISVWVTLVPPSESKPKATWSSEPYGLDYIRWSKEIAKLSEAYPNLIALSIDDFVLSNLNTFTPEYLGKMIEEFDKVNPDLSFIPCVYYNQITADFINKYGSLIDGILLPYRAESKGMNLQDANLIQSEVDYIRSILKKELPIYIDVYASAHSKLGATTPAYVEKVIKDGGAYADGVMIYVHPNPVSDSEKYKIIKDEFARLLKTAKK